MPLSWPALNSLTFSSSSLQSTPTIQTRSVQAGQCEKLRQGSERRAANSGAGEASSTRAAFCPPGFQLRNTVLPLRPLPSSPAPVNRERHSQSRSEFTWHSSVAELNSSSAAPSREVRLTSLRGGAQKEGGASTEKLLGARTLFSALEGPLPPEVLSTLLASN